MLRKWKPSWRRVAVWLVVLVVVLETARVLFGTNRHVVIPGMLYRYNQPSAASLECAIADDGIRTVVNLRGFCPGPESPWYAEEVRITNANGISQEDITLSANRLPPPIELRRLIEVFDRSEYPMLFHCKRGADRTGLAATIGMLLYSDASLNRARRQLWPRFGHFRFGRTAAIDEFFEIYERWLDGREHTPALFRDWAAKHYTPGATAGELSLTGGRSIDVPLLTPVGQWLAVKINAKNTAHDAWEMKPGNYAGVHVQFSVQNTLGAYVHSGQAGLFRRTVKPGETIELTIAIPPLNVPGRYFVRVDLMNATEAGVPIRQTGFYQFGSDPMMLAIEAQGPTR